MAETLLALCLLLDFLKALKLSQILHVEIAGLVQTRRMSQREDRGHELLDAASEFSIMSRTKFFHYALAYA